MTAPKMLPKPRAHIRTSDSTWGIADRYGADGVQVSELEELEYSGLLDARGNPLYRRRDRAGFLKFDN